MLCSCCACCASHKSVQNKQIVCAEFAHWQINQIFFVQNWVRVKLKNPCTETSAYKTLNIHDPTKKSYCFVYKYPWEWGCVRSTDMFRYVIYIHIWWSMWIRYTWCPVEFVPFLYNIINTKINFTCCFNCEKYIFAQPIFPLRDQVCFAPSGGCDDPDTGMSVTLRK